MHVVQKRLENNIKCRKSNRLTAFDNLRNLTTCENTRDISEVSDKKSKVEHRRLQLEKWKEEKEKRKKEATAQKKKPFVTGVVHAPLKFVPPPPLSKPMPSTSGRVTRSQVSKNVTKPKPKYSKITQSFAPNNATFKAPQLKNVIVLPTMTQALKKKEKIVYEFKPVLPNTSKENIKQTRAKTSNNKKIVEASITWHKKKTIQNKSKANINKQTPKKKMLSNILESSSSSEIFSSKSSESCNEVDMGTSTKFETLKRQSILLQSSSSSEVEGSSIEKSPILKSRTPRQSLPKNTKAFTPKNPVPKSESSSEEKLRSPKSPIDVSMTPEQIDEAKKISPCVTMSRGKDNARKEMKKKMEEGLLDEDTSDIDSVNHFRRQLDSEIKRMTEMCEVWEKIRDQTTLSESIQELVLSAVGQARLLMSQKLRQFSSLVDRCANPSPAHALVTPADLAGFWDMVFMQVRIYKK
ncbi:unnamed protein product [Diatraea saccharalis]|uniref:Uncharacterized protein n=1 Tax=Diatraea saccharalis TaxID=40085 RepID=A0A9N9RCX2_9NEOP|nr:unnamed protein product [Diatraea saccharalis]